MNKRREHKKNLKLVRKALASMDQEELKEFYQKISDAHKETVELVRPFLTRGNTSAELVGITLALLQMVKQNIVQCENMGVPLFSEMVEIFGEGIQLQSVAWKSTREDEDE